MEVLDGHNISVHLYQQAQPGHEPLSLSSPARNPDYQLLSDERNILESMGLPLDIDCSGVISCSSLGTTTSVRGFFCRNPYIFIQLVFHIRPLGHLQA